VIMILPRILHFMPIINSCEHESCDREQLNEFVSAFSSTSGRHMTPNLNAIKQMHLTASRFVDSWTYGDNLR
jgi:hypothetical protein